MPGIPILTSFPRFFNGVPVIVQHPWDLRTLRVLSSGLQTSFIYIIVNGNTGENPPEL